MRRWVAGCALVLLLVVVSSASIVSESSTGRGLPTAVALPADPGTPSAITVTVTSVDSSGFVEVPGYIVVLQKGLLLPATSAEESVSPSSLSVSVYTVKAGEDVVAFAVGYPAPEEKTGAGLQKYENATNKGDEQADDANVTSLRQPDSAAYGGGGERGIPTLSSNSLPILPGFGGRSRYYMLDIASNMTCFWVDLVWIDPDRPLDLTIYYPGGVLGTYDDMSDGNEDGRIYLRISNEAGIAEGNWFLKISGSKSFTSKNYTFMTYMG
ncbi:MAG TPA: hypothetical protein ENN52_08940 [Methanofollis liminatans]|uniref:Uncharacterized protein n=1 Tax=Methanofollis liminatans TaxID=2201 RepID=A0A831PPR1_9EURY|nr:hypothetical protein [Methanofollis liminatans]